MNKYLYIHKFDWNDESSSLMFNGEPKSNRVYFAEDDGDKYLLMIDQTKEYAGLSIQKGEFEITGENWDCDIEEVSVNNLLDLDLSTKDLKMMAENKLDKPTKENTEETFHLELIDSLGEVLSELRDYDKEAYETLVMITTVMSSAILSDGYIDLVGDLEKNPRTAKIANVSIATSWLEAYMNDINPLDMSHLLNSLRQLTIETIRLHKLNKNI
jgi:hypothetical protein